MSKWEYCGSLRAVEERLTTQQLQERAWAAGFEISQRRLEDWRYRGLMPRPERVGSDGKAPRWLYPAGAEEQLLALCRYREATKDLEAVRVALWVDGFPVDEQGVREAIGTVLVGMRNRVEDALAEEARRADPAGEPVTPETALDALAYRAAGVHGNRPTPRTIRMRRAERAHGISFLARLFMGYDLDERLADAKLAERAMGISAGRRGPAPYRWLDGKPEELADLRSIISLPVLIKAAETSTDVELRRARQFARAFVHGLPLIALFAEAMLGPRAAGLAAAKNINQADPEFYCMLVPALVAALRSGYAENLDTIQTALDGMTALAPDLEQLAALPEAERKRRIQIAPASERPQLRRLLQLQAEQQDAKTGKRSKHKI